ncbi:MAG: shikimate kinase [Calditrichaeota bacterium]|nr:MAG: shikimate kinase [Calditrichota bacterium]
MLNIPNKIFICGFMGAGKTVVSKGLADKLDFKYFDLDEIIESKTSSTILSIFETLGEKSFRKIESETLEEFIKKNERFILALGGGTLNKSENLKLVKENGELIFLGNSFEELWKRIENSNRPLVKMGKEFSLNLFLQRQKSYENSSIKINCFQKSIFEISNEIFHNLTTK